MKNIIAILIGIFILATCSEPTSSVAQENEAMPKQAATETAVVVEESRCGEKGKSEVTKIDIHLKKGWLTVDPYAAEAARGDELRFKVKINGNVDGIVYVGGKARDDIWIHTSNVKGADKFYVCIDPVLAIPEGREKKVFEYFIDAPGVGRLDPEVIVRR